MPIDATVLRTACQRQLKILEKDLLEHAAREPERDSALRVEWQSGRDAGRVGGAFEPWRDEQITQAAVHWVLGCVFVRFLEDNGLVGDPWLAGPGIALATARSRENEYYGQHPTHHERHWMETAFAGVVALRGGAGLFDPVHNPLYRWPLSPDTAKQLLAFWRASDPETGTLLRDFTGADWSTRFLGDLYQDLSERARKKYALLQTPEFIEEFILDRTLEPALAALPLEQVTLIDPSCGSGHFLLGAFARLFEQGRRVRPEESPASLAQRALDQIAGVDLNPFAVAIARFRLLLAALKASGITRLQDSPAFTMNVAVGDSLLHGRREGELGLGDGGENRYVGHAFASEDLGMANDLLSARYAVVVGNPPYITVKDKALNKAYRERFSTCSGKYALSVPFIERFWRLAIADAGGGVAGWIGMINSNSFMRREFGKKVVEDFFPQVDLTHVINTDGAYIPGHGTPTAILIGRAQSPQTDRVRVVMGIRGEPSTPPDPAHGLVWSEILRLVDVVDAQGTFVSVADMPRLQLGSHPWSMGGGGAAELKAQLEAVCVQRLESSVDSIGPGLILGDDSAFDVPGTHPFRAGFGTRLIVNGDEIRDWGLHSESEVVFPYNEDIELQASREMERFLWPVRSVLKTRQTFSKQSYEEAGIPYYRFHQIPVERNRTPLSIAFTEVATHNHFVFDRGGRVFKQTAPVIKLPAGATEADHLQLLAVLNSSVACFWLQQVCHNKGGPGGGSSKDEKWHDFYQHNGTKVGQLPVATADLQAYARALDSLAHQRRLRLPSALAESFPSSRAELDTARAEASRLRMRMIAVQEELDWAAYRAYGLLADGACNLPSEVPPPALLLGERAFEIALARKVADGSEDTEWFSWLGITPRKEVLADWPDHYRCVVERRLEAISSVPNVGLIEQPEYKRRWEDEAWGPQEERAIRRWLLDRIEALPCWQEATPRTTRDLTALLVPDAGFVQMAEIWQGATGAELEPVVRRLVLGESVPFLAALRYSDSGLVKRGIWEQTWALQRREDAVDAAVSAEVRRGEESQVAFDERLTRTQRERRKAEVGDIPRPPKYKREDLRQTEYWSLRGELDVPKERFTLFPYLGRDGDDAPLVGWAGWTALQQAQALGTLYADRQTREGWPAERLLPILAGVAELLPWILQWHNDYDAEYGMRLGEFYSNWLDQQLLAIGHTREHLTAWRPPSAPSRRAGRPRTAPVEE